MDTASDPTPPDSEGDAHGESHLSVRECWALLRASELGRLAVETEDGPDVFPINVVVDAGTVVFRSAEGAKLEAIDASSRVAFEIDGIEGDNAWSVVLRGTACRIRNVHDVFEAVELGVSPIQSGPKPSLVRITPHSVSGRSFTPTDRTEWSIEPLTRRDPID